MRGIDEGQARLAEGARSWRSSWTGSSRRSCPWGLILIGAFLAVAFELLGVPSLPVAVGVYLPISTSATMFMGGAVRWLVERKRLRRRSARARASDSGPGVLFSSGLIAGGAIMGVVIAAFQAKGMDGAFDLSHFVGAFAHQRSGRDGRIPVRARLSALPGGPPLHRGPRMRQLRLAALAALCFAAALSAQAPAPADLIITDARIYTVDDAHPFAEAMAVRGGKIAFVGSERDAMALRARRRACVDYAGRTIVPGMIDAHAHMLGLGEALSNVDLTGTASYDEVIARVVARAKSAPAGAWIIGRGWDQNQWGDTRFPTQEKLSRRSPTIRWCSSASTDTRCSPTRRR